MMSSVSCRASKCNAVLSQVSWDSFIHSCRQNIPVRERTVRILREPWRSWSFLLCRVAQSQEVDADFWMQIQTNFAGTCYMFVVFPGMCVSICMWFKDFLIMLSFWAHFSLISCLVLVLKNKLSPVKTPNSGSRRFSSSLSPCGLSLTFSSSSFSPHGTFCWWSLLPYPGVFSSSCMFCHHPILPSILPLTAHTCNVSMELHNTRKWFSPWLGALHRGTCWDFWSPQRNTAFCFEAEAMR